MNAAPSVKPPQKEAIAIYYYDLSPILAGAM